MQIIVNADDLGRHPDLTYGIMDAHDRGVVTSASLMVNFEASAEAAALARERPSLPVGLHFNLSSGHCVAATSRVQSLVDAGGWFQFDNRDVPGSVARLRARVASDRQVLGQVEREFWAQVERFRGLGLEPTHVDAHHYLPLVHIDLFGEYINLANQLSVPFRGLCYPMIDMLRVPEGALSEMKAMVRQSRVPSPELSLSNLLGGRPAGACGKEDYQRMVEAKLMNLASGGLGSAELVTHPARITEAVRHSDDYVWARELETALVSSPSFAQFLELGPYHLAIHADLR